MTDTGAFTYTIPIAAPLGTAGMVPALSLDYSSQNSNNGLVGAGWTISGLPSITRCPQTIATDWTHGGINYDSNDRFCLNGRGGEAHFCMGPRRRWRLWLRRGIFDQAVRS